MTAEQVAVRVLRGELARHPDGAAAVTAATDTSGLPRHQVQQLLHQLLSGKAGVAPPRVAWQAAPRGQRRVPETCPQCGQVRLDLPQHTRRSHNTAAPPTGGAATSSAGPAATSEPTPPTSTVASPAGPADPTPGRAAPGRRWT